jgi:hypothetical protein
MTGDLLLQNKSHCVTTSNVLMNESRRAIASQFWLSFFMKRHDYRLAAEDHCGDAKQEMKKQQCESIVYNFE